MTATTPPALTWKPKDDHELVKNMSVKGEVSCLSPTVGGRPEDHQNLQTEGCWVEERVQVAWLPLQLEADT